MGRRTVLTDSIGKYVGVPATDVQAYPGKTLQWLNDSIRFGKVQVKGYEAILVHMGTNDIGDIVRGRTSPTIQDIIQRLKDLIHLVKTRNSSCKLLLSAIIPRPKDTELSAPLIYGWNFAMANLCDQYKSLAFVPAYKFFVKSHQVVPTYYSTDGLHLNGPGVERLEQCFRQALSPKNLHRDVHWKRRRAMQVEVPISDGPDAASRD